MNWKYFVIWIVLMTAVMILTLVGCKDNIVNMPDSVNKYRDTMLVYSLNEFVLEDSSSGGDLYDGFYYQFGIASGEVLVKFEAETNWYNSEFIVQLNDNGYVYFEYIRAGEEEIQGAHKFSNSYNSYVTVDFTLHLVSVERVYKYVKLFNVEIYSIN